MKPEPLALTSFCSRIGSPAMKGERAIEPITLFMLSPLSRRIKLLLAVAAGQVCHCRSSSLTDWPRPMSDLATRISAVGNWATGWLGARRIGAARQICRHTAGTNSNGKDDDTGYFHTLHYSHAGTVRLCSLTREHD